MIDTDGEDEAIPTPPTQAWICEICTAMVIDRDKHEAFHYELTQAQADIAWLEEQVRGE